MTDVSLVYWTLTVLPLCFLAGTLVPLIPRAGVWFTTTPTRDQWISLSLFAFMLAMAAFGVRKLEFAVFMSLCGSAVLFQSWGPKRFQNGRVYGAYFVPLKLEGWERTDDKVLVRLGWGCRVLVADSATNRPFLSTLEDPSPAVEE